VLVGMQDVGIVQQQEIRDRGDQTLLVGAGNQQDGGMAHGGGCCGSACGFHAIITRISPIIAQSCLAAICLGGQSG
jgi:hypothetical protein